MQEQIDAHESLGARPQDRDRDGRAAPSAGGCRRDDALGRREASRRAVPGAARAAGHAAARRADEPSRRRERRVARAVPGGVSGDGRGDHARSVLPRQRRRSGFSSSIAAPGSRTRGTTARGWSRSARASRRRRRRSRRDSARCERELEWVRMAPRARQAKSKARIQKYEELAASDTVEKVSQNEIVIPPPPRLGNDVVIAKDVRKSVRRQAAVRESDVLAAARRHRRRHRTERRRKDDAVPDDRRRGEAGRRTTRRSATRCRSRTSIRGASSNGENTVYQEVSGGHDTITVGKREINARAYLASFNFRGSRSAEEGEGSVGRRAQPAASRRSS